MTVTEENGSTGKETSPSATLSTINLTCSVLALNPCLCGERPTTNRLSHARPVRTALYSGNQLFHHYFPFLHATKSWVKQLFINTRKGRPEGDGRVKIGETFHHYKLEKNESTV